jgi:hypothetical protein
MIDALKQRVPFEFILLCVHSLHPVPRPDAAQIEHVRRTEKEIVEGEFNV